MSLKTYISPQIQDFKKQGSPDLLFGLQIARPYVLLSIHDALNSNNSNSITVLKAIKLDANGTEIDSVLLASDLIIFDTDQYIIDTSKILATNLGSGIYFLQFLNGYTEYKTEPFLVKIWDYDLSADNILITTDNTLIKADNLTFNI